MHLGNDSNPFFRRTSLFYSGFELRSSNLDLCSFHKFELMTLNLLQSVSYYSLDCPCSRIVVVQWAAARLHPATE